jgi:hypothetical protein
MKRRISVLFLSPWLSLDGLVFSQAIWKASGYLLFLYDLGHLMIERHLHILIDFLHWGEEHPATFLRASEYSLDDPATFQDGLIVPLDFQHPPVLLDLNCSLAIFNSWFLSFTKNRKQVIANDYRTQHEAWLMGNIQNLLDGLIERVYDFLSSVLLMF